MLNINNFEEAIDPAFIDDNLADMQAIGSGDVEISGSGKVVIESISPVEVPMVDGSIGIFDSTGEFLGFKN